MSNLGPAEHRQAKNITGKLHSGLRGQRREEKSRRFDWRQQENQKSCGKKTSFVLKLQCPGGVPLLKGTRWVTEKKGGKKAPSKGKGVQKEVGKRRLKVLGRGLRAVAKFAQPQEESGSSSHRVRRRGG